MKSDLDHLPQSKQQELAVIQRTLLDEFEAAIGTATQPHKRNGKVYKIILFGSFARDDWVDEPENGYQSDYDLLVVVSHRDLTEIADYWYVAEDKILRDPAIARPVNIIVHSLDEVNQALLRGEYSGSISRVRASRFTSCRAIPSRRRCRLATPLAAAISMRSSRRLNVCATSLKN